MELIFGNRKNNRSMPLWLVGKSLFLLDTSLPYSIFSTKSYAEFIMSGIVVDVSKNTSIANVYCAPVIRCSITSEKKDIDASKPNFDKLELLKGAPNPYPAVDLSMRLYGRTKDGGRYQTYSIRSYDYFNPLAQAMNNAMAYTVGVVNGASQARTDDEAINYAINQASKNGGMPARDIAEFVKAYVTLKLLVSINILHLKTQYAPKILDGVKKVDGFHSNLVESFNKRFMQPENEWSANFKILSAYESLIDNPYFHTTPEFLKLKTQFKGFGVDLTLPLTTKTGDVPLV